MCGCGRHTCPGLTRWRTFSHIVTSNISAFQFKILHCALNIRSSVLQMATGKNPEKFDKSFDRSACPSFDFIHAGWRLITVVKESSPLFSRPNNRHAVLLLVVGPFFIDFRNWPNETI